MKLIEINVKHSNKAYGRVNSFLVMYSTYGSYSYKCIHILNQLEMVISCYTKLCRYAHV